MATRFAVEYWPKSKNSGWYPTKSYATLPEAESARAVLAKRQGIKKARIRLISGRGPVRRVAAPKEREMPTKREIRRAKAVVATPEFKQAVMMHTILAHCYEGQKSARLQAYKDAGIPELLKAAHKRSGK